MLKRLKPWTCTAYDTFAEELEASLERITEEPGAWLTNGFDGLRAVTMAHPMHHSRTIFEAVILEPTP